MKTMAMGMILVILLTFTNVNISESSTLGKLVVKVKPESDTVSANQSPVIVGTVTNEGGKPVESVKVRISFSSITIYTTTDSEGNFRYVSNVKLTTGTYVVNVVASKEGYGTGYASTRYFVQAPKSVTYSKKASGLPLIIGNYTVYLGKVTDWNLETTCFVKFGDEYKRFLRTCDLYALAPDDFKSDKKTISTVTVVKYGNDYRLFAASKYFDVLNLTDEAQVGYISSTWKNYTAPN